jgi:signal transduction histidine kinase
MSQAMSRRTITRLAWSIWALSVVLVAIKLFLQSLNDPSLFLGNLFNALVLLGFATVGALVVSRRPENPIGWIVSGGTLLWALGDFALEGAVYALVTVPGALPGGAWMAWLGFWVRGLGWVMVMFFLLLFPTGRLPSARWLPAVWLAVGYLALFTVVTMLGPSSLEIRLSSVRNPVGIEIPGGIFDFLSVLTLFGTIGTMAVGAAAVIVRFGRAQEEERQQLKWLAYGAAFGTITIGATVVASFFDIDLGSVPFYLAVAGFPIAIGIAILRYRLWDIDLLINRTLVYGALTASVVGIYVLVVGYLGVLFRTHSNLIVSLLATGLVAVLFQPLRDRLQRGVNRLMYGERDDPYAVLSRLGQRLEATLAPEAVLPTIVETVKESLKLPYAAITLKLADADTFAIVSSAGTPVAESLTLPLVYQHETVGQLLLAPRAPGETFSPADRRLLDDLAREAGVAVYAVRLTTDLQRSAADLQRSRERLVTTREEERRRLRRDLHDGLGPTLASLAQRLNTARVLIPRDSDAAIALLGDLETQVKTMIAEIRQLVYALRPPALDELGLVSALREHAEHYNESNGLYISMEAPEHLAPLPAAVEVAAYRIVLEALTNVARHAHARTCHIHLELREAQELYLEVTDDGNGLPNDHHAGVGLTSMRERALELGGECRIEPGPTHGIRVVARLPLPPSEE